MYKKIPDRDKLQAGAAILAAEDELSDSEIAHRCGITRRTLMRWKKQPAFQWKIDEHLRLSKLESESQTIVERQKRIAEMDRIWKGLQDIIRNRANSPEMASVPGGTTGLLRRRKVFRSQGHGELVADYELDRALLQEMRRLEVLASKSLRAVADTPIPTSRVPHEHSPA